MSEATLPFRVENDGQATWAMKELREKSLKIRENERIAKEQLDAIATWLQDVNGALSEDCSRLQGYLTDYLRRERDNRKSIKLAWGTIKSRVVTKIEVDPEFVTWAQENDRDDLLRYPPPEPNKTAIKNEPSLPHVEVVESVSFSVEIKE